MENNILPNGTRVKAFRTADYNSDYAIGIIDGYSHHTGPIDSPDNSFYFVLEYTDKNTPPNIIMTPFVDPDGVYQFEQISGRISVDQYPSGIPVQASNNDKFTSPVEGILSGQLYLNNEQLFTVKHFSEKLGMFTESVFTHARLADESIEPLPIDPTPVDPVPEQPEEPNTPINKAQLYGLLTQLTNLVNNKTDTAAAMRSVADLYSKPDEVLSELASLREIVRQLA
jgi:hypothetical protein